MAHAINWFDIPAVDYNRAVKFYSTILGADMIPFEGMENYSMFPSGENEISGGLGTVDSLKPSGDSGALVYLNGGDDLSTVLDRVEGAGGKVVLPKTSIGPNGFVARFHDTEGNLVGLHSMG
ncbi:MAG: VOC family protein [Aggregatilineales bacterium]